MKNSLRELNDEGAAARWAALMYPNTPKPAKETKTGQDRLRAYHQALGCFVDSYAHVELLTFLALRWHTKTSADIARAVFSGVRVNEALGYFRRLAEIGAIDAKEWSALSPVVDQLKTINQRRNDILHHGADGVASGEGVVSNQAMALKLDRIQSFPISPEILDDMTADLHKITAHLLTRHLGRPSLRGKHPELDAVLSRAWQYKQKQAPVQKPGKSARKGRGKNKARQDQPKSSQK
jgi:hypothetical protein